MYELLRFVWVSLLVGCVSAPKPADWLAVGFRTPEQTFRTFQTGLRSDQPDLEYRSFSYRFKKANGINQGFYREFRKELFAAHPLLRWAATAEIVGREELHDGTVRLTARLDTWLHDEVFTVDFIREDFYEIRRAGEIADDDIVRFEDHVAYRNESYLVSIPDEAGVPVEEVSEIRVGHSWLISGFPTITPD